ncbi:MAG: hypothetical protein EOO29_00485 [Comamonadaceae bacterium]|nr:MAG: hypothetical protein EOO29_00485 [Comamonadaceae bacterium]
MNPPRILGMLTLCCTLALPALAHEGHDDGAAAAPTGAQLPRFALESEAFELVGVLDGRRLALYLDRFTSNEPVQNAKIELQLGEQSHAAQPHGEGEYELMLPAALPPGDLAVTATINAGDETDLLAGELHIEPAHAEALARTTPAWRRALPWAGAALIALIALGVARRKRHQPTPGAAA